MHKVLEKIILHRDVKNAISFLKDDNSVALVLVGVFIFTDILFIKTNSDFVIFSVLLFYVIFIKIFKINSKLTFLFCLGLLVLMSVDYFFTQASISTEKAAVWLILFLVVGVIQGWKE